MSEDVLTKLCGDKPLNEDQRRIVTTLDRPLFVEAGAGSGKTFTLTLRIVWALSKGSAPQGKAFLDDLSQALIITFTNAAAQEIKERVRSTLRRAGMNEAALQVDSAWISTIHGMCSRILKRHAFDLGIDPQFQVASTNKVQELLARSYDAVVGAAWRDSSGSDALRVAFDSYGLGSTGPEGERGLINVVSMVRSLAAASPLGYKGLRVPEPENIYELMQRVLQAHEALAAQHLTPKAAESLAARLEVLRQIDNYAPYALGFDEALSLVEAAKKNPAPRKPKDPDIACMIDDAKQLLDSAQLELMLGRLRPVADEVIRLAQKVDKHYMSLKRRESVLDNDDLISLALEAVQSNEQVRADYAGRFRLVMVDEFQDTDAKQLALISALSGEGAQHLATVGDAQQSIYRFRGADVSVFQSRGARLSAEEHVRLAVNYRSHADVLALVDKVCSGERGVLQGFMHLDHNPKRTDGYKSPSLPRINLELTTGARGSSSIGRAIVATAIADRLKSYIDAGEKPADMALLLGSTSHAGLYIDAIRSRGIDCVVTGGSNFTKAPEVGVMAALLHTLANPYDTQSGLFPLLSSPMFDLDAQDFVQLGTRKQKTIDAPTKRSLERGLQIMEFYGNKGCSSRLQTAFEVLERARTSLRILPVADVCMQVVRESGWLLRLEREGAQAASVEANILAAIRYIRDLTDDLGLGPARAAREFDIWLQMSKIAPATLAGGDMSSVRIMTIHASKGLEFPITALSELWSNPRPTTGIRSGKGPHDTTMFVPVPPGSMPRTPQLSTDNPQTMGEWFEVLGERAQDDEFAEKTRLLYVALTRAREALIIGMFAEKNKDGALAPKLAAATLDALFAGNLPCSGETSFAYGGTREGRCRHVELSKSSEGWCADSRQSLPGADGLLPPTDVDTLAHMLAAVSGDQQAAREQDAPASSTHQAEPFLLFEPEVDTLRSKIIMDGSRPGVYSYSSAHVLLCQRKEERRILPTRAQRDAQQEGAPNYDDADKATNLGSAFHELAQIMVETQADTLPESRVQAICRYWNLSAQATRRLKGALSLWQHSAIRAEALSYNLLQAELPFFLELPSEFGSHVEGAIDLLATNKGEQHAFLIDYKTGDKGLSIDDIYERHSLQANFYATVLMRSGYTSVSCNFVCVELDRGDGEPVVVRYDFDASNPPSL